MTNEEAWQLAASITNEAGMGIYCVEHKAVRGVSPWHAMVYTRRHRRIGKFEKGRGALMFIMMDGSADLWFSDVPGKAITGRVLRMFENCRIGTRTTIHAPGDKWFRTKCGISKHDGSSFGSTIRPSVRTTNFGVTCKNCLRKKK